MGGGLLGAAMSALALDSTQSPFYRRYKLVLRMAVVAAIGAVTMLGLLLKVCYTMFVLCFIMCYYLFIIYLFSHTPSHG